MLPDDEKTRPAGNGTGLENDLLGGGVNTDSTPSELVHERVASDELTLADEVSDAAELTVASALLFSRSVEDAQQLLALTAVPVQNHDRVELVPAAAFSHPTAKFVVEVSTQLITDLVIPAPLTVVTYAQQHKMTLPHRQAPIAALWKLASASPVIGVAVWAAREVRSNYFRKTISAAGQRISLAAWSDPAELAELVGRELTVISEAVKAVTG